ncbi:MAG TPA: aminotransferase class V-fold PLP-dependent enzyme [Verrucomicrobiales bacterium]|nr:aminotransferase class V-fold PLP-dependent enzyme [Verrucomicrobiales bacterium]
MIYLDNNATTPLDPVVLEAMQPFLREHFANPSSGYGASQPVRKALGKAREQVAALLDCTPEEIIFTSGGTEADNAAIFSATRLYPDRRHIITCATEHDAVLNYCAFLEKQHGYEITRLSVTPEGIIRIEELEAALRPGRTAIVSLMWGNNETGVLGPVPEAAALAEKAGVLFHTDAVQAGAKIPVSLRGGHVHYLALSGHKFHAPKGVGVLYVNHRVAFQPWMLGGGQENSRRAGTENVAAIVALGAAAEQARLHMESGGDEIGVLRDHFEAELSRRLSGVHVNGHRKLRTPNTSSLRIDGVEAAAMMVLLDRAGVCVSAGSACHTGSLHVSHVLSAMGLTREQASQTLRVSLSRFTTRADVEEALTQFVKAGEKVRSLLPAGG